MSVLPKASHAIEARAESEPLAAAQPTADAYSILCTDIARRACSVPVEQAAYMGQQLGRTIYLLDVIKDLDQDRHQGTYNPLLLGTLSASVRRIDVANQLHQELTHFLVSMADYPFHSRLAHIVHIIQRQLAEIANQRSTYALHSGRRQSVFSHLIPSSTAFSFGSLPLLSQLVEQDPCTGETHLTDHGVYCAIAVCCGICFASGGNCQNGGKED